MKAAMFAAENLDYEPLAFLLERGFTTPALLKWIAVLRGQTTSLRFAQPAPPLPGGNRREIARWSS